MAHQLDPLPLPHGLKRFLSTNSTPKEKTLELAQIRDFCHQVGTFSGSHKEDIRDFLHNVDVAARENGLSSFKVAKVLVHQQLKGKAKTFAEMALAMQHRYPHANYYQEQLRVQGRNKIRYQAPILERIPSASSTDGLVRTHSEEEVLSAASVDSVASVASVPGNPQAVPIVQHVPHVDRIPHRPRRHHRSRRSRRDQAVPPIHPRRRHISPRIEIPDLPAIDPEDPVQEDECLRHYLFEAFYKEEDPEIAHTAFIQSLNQDRQTSVRSWIWDMQLKQSTWYKKFHGAQNYQHLARTNEPFMRQAELEIVSAVKRNSVEEFKTFYQQMEASNPNCMKTIEQCQKIAFAFENNYDPGIKFTSKTKSETKRYAMEAQLVDNYDDSSRSTSTQQLPPPPQGLSQEQWQIALSAMSSNYSPHQQFHQTPNFSQELHAPNEAMENSAAASARGNRGGGTRGSPSNKGGRGGGAGQGQSGSTKSDRQKPPPNTLHKNGKETWDPQQKLIDTWTGTKPVIGKAICYYCALPNHCTSECGRRRRDLADGIDRPFHPDRGHLRGARFNHRVAQRMVKQGKAQNVAQAVAQVEQREQARINQAKAAAHQSTSAAAVSISNTPTYPVREGGTPYANLQFPTNQAPSYNQGSYNAHYSTAPANAATISHPPQLPLYLTAPAVPAPGSNPMMYLPPAGSNPMLNLPQAPIVPDLRTIRPLNWAEESNAEATAEELRRANQVNNNLIA